MNKKIYAMMLMAALLAGCSSAPQNTQNERAQAQSAETSAPALMQRSGRFAVLARDNFSQRNTDAVQGGVLWTDRGDALKLELLTPLGATLSTIEAGPGYANLTDNAGKTLRAANVDDLVEKALQGKPMPVSGMRYWVRGELMPSVPAQNVARSSDGKLQSFSQNGWTAQLSDYDEQGPRMMKLQRDDGERRITVRLKID